MTITLPPPSVATIQSIVGFSKLFSADLVKITSTHAAAIDDIPSLFIMFNGISYAGPELVLTRIRNLAQRLVLPTVKIEVITGGPTDLPKSLLIKSGKSTIDFRVASSQSSTRIPSKFAGVFVTELELNRTDFTTAIASASSIGSKLLTFVSDGVSLKLTARSEGETYTASLDDVKTSSVFEYNYTVEYLSVLDKVMSKAVTTVKFSVTAKGHMKIDLPTDVPQIVASVFLLDVKNR